MPTLLILGRYDSEISLDNSMKFALTVPDGYVAVMNEAGIIRISKNDCECGKNRCLPVGHVDHRKPEK